MKQSQIILNYNTKQLHFEKSRANQIDMTGPNSVVLFAQTLVCSLCNYYIQDNVLRGFND